MAKEVQNYEYALTGRIVRLWRCYKKDYEAVKALICHTPVERNKTEFPKNDCHISCARNH
jgi:hypothetical protein